jgi:uncharacterized protein YwbE
MVVVLASPLFALGQHEFLCVLERGEGAFALNQVAGLAGRHQIVHASAATSGVRMNVVDRQDQPILEVTQAVQAAILALEMIPPENLHGFFARQTRRAKEKPLDMLEGHGSSFRGSRTTRRDCLRMHSPDDLPLTLPIVRVRGLS